MYFFKIGGYLSAVDIIREIGGGVRSGERGGKIGRSEAVKRGLIEKVFGDGEEVAKIDGEARR
jgi:hypothetical protein